MIDPQKDELIPLRDVRIAKGRPVSVATVYRWVMQGVRGVKLETVLCGGRRYTTEVAVKAFFAALTNAGGKAVSASPGKRERNIRQAEEQLARAGI